MNIGIGVEGPSDRTFWDKILHKHFPGMRFDIRSMNNRDKLIRETPRLLNAFRDNHYVAGIIILDNDRSPCITSILNEFEAGVREEVRKPARARYLLICVAIRELEAWFLADGSAIAAVLPKSKFTPPKETATLPAEKILVGLWQQQYGRVAFNKIDFASRIAPKFEPEKALKHSASFRHFWNRMGSIARLGVGGGGNRRVGQRG
ncbi:MAG: DUF4276 family protein [Acidobacteria bacterium]|nr:DUF4276 family protein [Acidobacteriota bacterium]